jgi:hypothetical protein
MSDTDTIRPRVVRQVSLASGLPHDGFRPAYEAAVPAFDQLEAAGVERSASTSRCGS